MRLLRKRFVLLLGLSAAFALAALVIAASGAGAAGTKASSATARTAQAPRGDCVVEEGFDDIRAEPAAGHGQARRVPGPARGRPALEHY